MRKYLMFLIVCMASSSIFFTGSSYALKLPSGTWRVEISTQSPMTPQAIKKIEEVCMKSGEFDPVEEMTKEGGCTVSDKKETDHSISWKMTCGMQGMPPMQGEGKFVVSGKKASGNMKISMGQMVMKNSWQGELISNTCK